ncbi:MAG: patatin-like phospholipase family protein [Solirubrobacteraceae bacterium]
MKVLSIDGGGIRGLIPALVLAEIERRTGRPTAELFDLIAGTSTGGILACGLTRPGPDGKPLHSADALAGLYRTEGPKIFDRSLRKRIASAEGLLDERYDDRALNAALETYLGDARLRDAVTDVLIPAYDFKDRFAFFFRSAQARADATYDFSMAEAARATAAAPTYFEPVQVTDAAGARTYSLIDGGVFAVNPAVCAYAEVVGAGADISVIAALGTGSHTKAYEFEDVKGWGALEWAQPLLDMVFDGAADTVDFEATTLSRGRYRRLQAILRYSSDALDDAGEANLRRLEGDAERLIAERSQDIEALCEEVAG